MTREEARGVLRGAADEMRRVPSGGAFLEPALAFRVKEAGSDEWNDVTGEFAGPRFAQLREAFAVLGFGAVPRNYSALPPGATDRSRFDPAWVAGLDRDALDRWVIWAGRGERFCTGFDAGLIKSGIYAVAAERALDLTPAEDGETASPAPCPDGQAQSRSHP